MEVDTSLMAGEFRRISQKQILEGSFAREFTAIEEQSTGGVDARLAELYQLANKSELAQGERRVRMRMGLSVD